VANGYRRLARTYLDGAVSRSAFRTVFFEHSRFRAITLIGIFSPYKRRISAQSSTDNTSLPPWLD
jgi:hypothetical protein